MRTGGWPGVCLAPFTSELGCAVHCQERGWEFHVLTPQIEGDPVTGPQGAATRTPFSALRITLS